MSNFNETLMVQAALSRFQVFRLQLTTVVPQPGGNPALKTPHLHAGVQAARPAMVAANHPQFNLPGAAGSGSSGNQPRPTGTPMPQPPALFKAASNDQADCDFQREVHDAYSNYIHQICRAICLAHTEWKMTARFEGVMVNGISATGGRIVGSDLGGFIIANGPSTGLFGNASAWTRAIAKSIGDAWHEFMRNTTVPGLPWYPAFAAFPGPMAPPMPNVPTPMAALAYNLYTVSPMAIEQRIVCQMGTGEFVAELASAIAVAFSGAVSLWLPTQMVMLVMGKGPIPTFAPPYVPVGPVVGGDIISTPGHLMS